MVKKLFILFVVCIAGITVQAQQTTDIQPCEKLYSKFQSDYLENMRQTAPQEVKFWNWFTENGYIVKKTDPQYAKKYPLLYFFDKDTKERGEAEVAYTEGFFNIMAYDFEILPEKYNTYRIGDTGYTINILSSRKLTKRFNDFLSNEQ